MAALSPQQIIHLGTWLKLSGYLFGVKPVCLTSSDRFELNEDSRLDQQLDVCRPHHTCSDMLTAHCTLLTAFVYENNWRDFKFAVTNLSLNCFVTYSYS